MPKYIFLAVAFLSSLMIQSVAHASGDEDYRKHKMCIQGIDTSRKIAVALQSKLIERQNRAVQQRMSKEAFDRMLEQDGSLKEYRLAQENFEKSKSCTGELQWSKRVVNALCPGVTLPLKTPQSQTMCEELALNFYDQQAIQAHINQHSRLTSSQREVLQKSIRAQRQFVDENISEKLQKCSAPSFTSPMYMGDRFDDYIASNGLNAAIDHYNSSLGVLEDHVKGMRRSVACRHDVINQVMKQAHDRLVNQAEISQMLEGNQLLAMTVREEFVNIAGGYVDHVAKEGERQQRAMAKHLNELDEGLKLMSDKIDRARASQNLAAEERKRAEDSREIARQRERRLRREAQEWSQFSRPISTPYTGGTGVTVLPGQR